MIIYRDYYLWEIMEYPTYGGFHSHGDTQKKIWFIMENPSSGHLPKTDVALQ